jgi:hypothetical protein
MREETKGRGEGGGENEAIGLATGEAGSLSFDGIA